MNTYTVIDHEGKTHTVLAVGYSVSGSDWVHFYEVMPAPRAVYEAPVVSIRHPVSVRKEGHGAASVVLTAEDFRNATARPLCEALDGLVKEHGFAGARAYEISIKPVQA